MDQVEDDGLKLVRNVVCCRCSARRNWSVGRIVGSDNCQGYISQLCQCRIRGAEGAQKDPVALLACFYESQVVVDRLAVDRRLLLLLRGELLQFQVSQYPRTNAKI